MIFPGVVRTAYLPRVDAQDRNTGFRTGRRELNFAIDTTWSQQCRVKDIFREKKKSAKKENNVI